MRDGLADHWRKVLRGGNRQVNENHGVERASEGMSRTFFSLRRKRGLWFAASSPLSDRSDARVLCLALWFRVLLCTISAAACSLVGQRRSVSETGKHSWLYGVNHGSICDSRPSAFSGYPRGHRVNTEAQCHRHCAPTGDKDAHPRTRASQEPTGHHQKKITGDGRLFP